MRQIKAFTAKELTELVRTGKLLLLMILFVLFGIMNPAIAKLTPWLLEMTAKSMADTGLTVTAIQVDATASWTQFYKNVPLAMILFLLLCAGTLTNEYQKGTLINVVTKGLDRWKIFVSKWAVLAAVWTAGYWLLYGITYGYTAWFWDNSTVSYPGFSAMCLAYGALANFPGNAGIGSLFLRVGCAGIGGRVFPRPLPFIPPPRPDRIPSHTPSERLRRSPWRRGDDGVWCSYSGGSWVGGG